MLISKRYKDIFDQYVHKGEPTPLTIGSLVVCGLCFLFILIATFTCFNISHPWFEYVSGEGFIKTTKEVFYNPLIPVMIFIIYILGRNYSFVLFVLYLLTGFFIYPIFVFGGGLDYIQNYLFGYFLGFVAAIFVAGGIFKINQSLKTRLVGALLGIISIHICGFLYCFVLAVFKIVEFNIVLPVANGMSTSKIMYDILFGSIVILVAPWIKNILWVCMKPKADTKKQKLKNTRKRNKIISDNVYQHRQNYN